MHEEMFKTLAIKEMQIKTTLKFLFTLDRSTIMKKSSNKWWGGFQGKGAFIYYW
jgi:hypothetical protein